jgi:hypothetical protein
MTLEILGFKYPVSGILASYLNLNPIEMENSISGGLS